MKRLYAYHLKQLGASEELAEFYLHAYKMDIYETSKDVYRIDAGYPYALPNELLYGLTREQLLMHLQRMQDKEKLDIERSKNIDVNKKIREIRWMMMKDKIHDFFESCLTLDGILIILGVLLETAVTIILFVVFIFMM